MKKRYGCVEKALNAFLRNKLEIRNRLVIKVIQLTIKLITL